MSIEEQLLDLGVGKEDLKDLSNKVVAVSRLPENVVLCYGCKYAHIKAKNSVKRCHGCNGEGSCDRCFKKCDLCKTSTCEACSMECGKCGIKIVCNDCTRVCKGDKCTKTLCKRCISHYCDGASFCQECFDTYSIQCEYVNEYTCHSKLCPKCVKKCKSCGFKTCQTHYKKCMNLCVNCKVQTEGCNKCQLRLWCSNSCKESVLARLKEII